MYRICSSHSPIAPLSMNEYIGIEQSLFIIGAVWTLLHTSGYLFVTNNPFALDFSGKVNNMSPVLLVALFVTVSGSALYGPCDSDDNCGTLDTFCKNGTCMCQDDFAVFDDHCVRLASPHIPCTHKINCKPSLGQKGICPPDKHCACKSFHHLHNSQCVKSKGLDEECDHDHQCYCGKNCSDKIECVNRLCACKPGYKNYSRRCIPDIRVSSSQTTNASSVKDLVTMLSIFTAFFVQVL